MALIYKVINQVGGSGGGGTSKYDQSFNATTSWGAASGGFYSITVLQSTHGAGTEPIVQVYEDVSGDFEHIELGVTVSPTGDVTIQVTETPDNRFAGRIIII